MASIQARNLGVFYNLANINGVVKMAFIYERNGYSTPIVPKGARTAKG